MRGWPVIVYFESQEAAQKAADSIGNIVGESSCLDINLLQRIIDTWGKPSMALTVGLKETKIARNRKTPWDR